VGQGFSPDLRRIAVGLIAVAMVAVGVWLWQSLRAAAFPPFIETSDQNILLITIDTLRADALGSYGGRAKTPNLDRLAREGVRFTFAHAQAVLTLVSHSSIMTGEYPYQHGVRDNAGFRLADSATTLAELAHAKGFATGAFVAAFPLDRHFGIAQGFDTYDDVSGREVRGDGFEIAERPASEVVSAADTWIASQRKPWFAWVHVFDPHSPYAPPPPYDREYADDLYAGEVAYVDAALAPLLQAAHSSARATTIIVTGDHGEGLGDHGEATHGVFAYESTLHIPLILAQIGGGIPARDREVVSHVPVRHVDILPTIAGLAGLDLPSNLPGRTLLTARDGETEPRPSYFEAMMPMLKRGWAPLWGVIDGRDKYIDLPIEELYDLGADPKEERNLAPKEPVQVRTLTARLKGFGAALPGEQIEETGETRERLRALGYVSAAAPRKARYGEEDDPKRLIDVDHLMMRGIELHQQHRDAEAIDAYRRVIERRPDMGLAYRRLAFLQWENGAPQDAIATLRRAIDVIGADVDIDIRLGTYLAETGAVTEAIPMLERAAKAEPDNTEALNALGIAYAHAGRNADALRTFARILTINPRDAFAIENTAAVYMQQGKLAAAREAFARAAANDPRSSRAQAGLGVVAIKSGDREAAIQYWKHAVALDATNYDALYNLASELLGAGRTAEARPYAEQFVRTAPRAFYAREIEQFRRALQ
jgi:arylsulfatase A-like enzyme/Flp pilus assembly protein TadD